MNARPNKKTSLPPGYSYSYLVTYEQLIKTIVMSAASRVRFFFFSALSENQILTLTLGSDTLAEE
jgi:hypothetical protein